MRLLLFDVDGTLLLKANGEHREALCEAIRATWHVGGAEDVPVDCAGRTDLDIARDILVNLGVDARRIDDGLADFREAATEVYSRRCPDDLTDHVAPGMDDALRDLRARGDAILALCTGNLEPIARLKLERAGLGAFFERGDGAFGSDHEDRAVLPPLARKRAGHRRHLDGPWPRSATVVIGDTPRDIACARADGIHVVAIATGPFGPDQLRDADVVVEHASELPAALAAFRT